jgi:F-type H+-transporting ATPase subunit epsilon
MPFRCEIVSQDHLVFDGEADIVVAPGTEGILGILPHHAPLLTTLQMGILQVRYQSREENFAISGGFMEVRPDGVTVLADAAEHESEIDETRAEEARKRAEALLQAGLPRESDDYLRAEAALRRSSLRLNLARRRKVGGRS